MSNYSGFKISALGTETLEKHNDGSNPQLTPPAGLILSLFFRGKGLARLRAFILTTSFNCVTISAGSGRSQ